MVQSDAKALAGPDKPDKPLLRPPKLLEPYERKYLFRKFKLKRQRANEQNMLYRNETHEHNIAYQDETKEQNGL